MSKKRVFSFVGKRGCNFDPATLHGVTLFMSLVRSNQYCHMI